MKRAAGRLGLLVLAAMMLESCISVDEPSPSDCDDSPAAFVVEQVVNSSSCEAADGSIKVTGSAGKEPWSFSINGGLFQSSTTFSNLPPGTYEISVRDALGCEGSQPVVVAGPTGLSVGTLATSPSGCKTSAGSISVAAVGGTAPFEYKLDGGVFQSSGTFVNLSAGTYEITVRDGDGCESASPAVVRTGTSYSSQIAPILTARCNLTGCHNGDLGPSRNWSTYPTVRDNAVGIKSRTADKSMPPSGSTALTADEINLIACWVDDGAINN
jgi:hypothetical protein